MVYSYERRESTIIEESNTISEVESDDPSSESESDTEDNSESKVSAELPWV